MNMNFGVFRLEEWCSRNASSRFFHLHSGVRHLIRQSQQTTHISIQLPRIDQSRQDGKLESTYLPIAAAGGRERIRERKNSETESKSQNKHGKR